MTNVHYLSPKRHASHQVVIQLLLVSQKKMNKTLHKLLEVALIVDWSRAHCDTLFIESGSETACAVREQRLCAGVVAVYRNVG